MIPYIIGFTSGGGGVDDDGSQVLGTYTDSPPPVLYMTGTV